LEKYIVRSAEIEAMEGVEKAHFLNPDAQRNNKSLGDLTGLTGIGFHIIEVPPGKSSTEFHVHHHEDECTYVLSGCGTVFIGSEQHAIAEGDFIGYRKAGEAHTMRNEGLAWDLVDHANIDHPSGGRK